MVVEVPTQARIMMAATSVSTNQVYKTGLSLGALLTSVSCLPSPGIKAAVTVTFRIALIVCFISAKFFLRKTTKQSSDVVLCGLQSWALISCTSRAHTASISWFLIELEAANDWQPILFYAKLTITRWNIGLRWDKLRNKLSSSLKHRRLIQ